MVVGRASSDVPVVPEERVLARRGSAEEDAVGEGTAIVSLERRVERRDMVVRGLAVALRVGRARGWGRLGRDFGARGAGVRARYMRVVELRK